MKPFSPPLRRPIVTHESILRELRGRIVTGLLGPGDRLPTRRELQREFGTTRVTVQRAMQRLTKEAFVVPRGKLGTFVSPNPPHLGTYALIFPQGPSRGLGEWPRFWEAMENEARRFEDGGRFEIYHSIDRHADSPDFHRLVRDMESQRLTGLAFAWPPGDLWGTSLLKLPGIPRVAILMRQWRDIAAVRLSGAFLDKALDYLLSYGRRHVAFIHLSPAPEDTLPRIRRAVARRGMICPPYWLQGVARMTSQCAREVAHLLMNPDQRRRPDGLVIMDDNLVEPATAGLVDAGVRVPRDLQVVAHCNFPWPTPSSLPVKRLGPDARHVLAACVRSIQLQRAGRRAATQNVPVLFDP